MTDTTNSPHADMQDSVKTERHVFTKASLRPNSLPITQADQESTFVRELPTSDLLPGQLLTTPQLNDISNDVLLQQHRHDITVDQNQNFDQNQNVIQNQNSQTDFKALPESPRMGWWRLCMYFLVYKVIFITKNLKF